MILGYFRSTSILVNELNCNIRFVIKNGIIRYAQLAPPNKTNGTAEFRIRLKGSA